MIKQGKPNCNITDLISGIPVSNYSNPQQEINETFVKKSSFFKSWIISYIPSIILI